jgi:hypothetical protein
MEGCLQQVDVMLGVVVEAAEKRFVDVVAVVIFTNH